MHRQAVAEWLLGQFMSRDRAGVVAGDLVETAGGDAARFRWLLLMTLFSLARESAGAYLGAVTLGGAGLGAVQALFVHSVRAHTLSPGQRMWVRVLPVVCGWVWVATCFLAIRYGLRDTMTRLAFGIAALGSLAVAFCWVAWVPVAAVACFCALGAVCLATKAARRAFVAVALLMVILPLLMFSFLFLFSIPLGWLVTHGHGGISASKPILYSWFACYYVIVVAIVCGVCGRVHRRVLA